MKKTFITLLALAGVAAAAPERGEQLWTLTFGTDINGSTDYLVTNYGETTYAPSTTYDIEGLTGEDYVSTNGSNKRVHTQWSNGSGLTWNGHFEVEIVFFVPENFANNSKWPVVAELSGNGTSLRFGPYTQQSNAFYVDGVNLTKNEVETPLTLTTGTKHTASLSVFEGTVTLKLDGAVAQTGTLADSVSGNITDIALGGNSGDAYRLQENVYSISAYKLIPEPATATLSLLALAGLAARRRRK